MSPVTEPCTVDVFIPFRSESSFLIISLKFWESIALTHSLIDSFGLWKREKRSGRNRDRRREKCDRMTGNSAMADSSSNPRSSPATASSSTATKYDTAIPSSSSTQQSTSSSRMYRAPQILEINEELISACVENLQLGFSYNSHALVSFTYALIGLTFLSSILLVQVDLMSVWNTTRYCRGISPLLDWR